MRYTSLNSEEIKALRANLGYTQEQCANIVGISVRQWSKFENGYPCSDVYIRAITFHTTTLKIPLSEYDIEVFKDIVYGSDGETEEWTYTNEAGEPVNLIFIKDTEM